MGQVLNMSKEENAIDRLSKFVTSAQSHKRVTGSTHAFYRYPARYSPDFVKAAIRLFTASGDTVLDPFMGGGTTLVEACRLGRRAIGIDISSLSSFVSRVKTTTLTRSDIHTLSEWSACLPAKLNLRKPEPTAGDWAKHGYLRNINGKDTWPIRKTIQLALAAAENLPRGRQCDFARCALLRTGQWALDCRTQIPSASQFRDKLLANMKEMLNAISAYSDEVKSAFGDLRGEGALCLNRSSVGIEDDPHLKNKPPRLILTSPPYPGVHVLYHRWQIRGRRETPAPFWIANCNDGNPGSFYTFGDRKQRKLSTYFEQLEMVFSSLARIANDNTTVVQMVAFSEPSWQLPMYLNTMKTSGFREIKLTDLEDSIDGRLWRDVPNRKWYATQKGSTSSSKEVVLLHRLA